MIFCYKLTERNWETCELSITIYSDTYKQLAMGLRNEHAYRTFNNKGMRKDCQVFSLNGKTKRWTRNHEIMFHSVLGNQTQNPRISVSKLIALLAFSTDSVCVNFFGFTRPTVPVLTGEVDSDLMTVPKLSKNSSKNVPLTLRRERYTSLNKVPSKFPRIKPKNVPITLNRERYTRPKKYLANVPELYQKNVPITLSRERYTSLKKHLANVPKLYPKCPNHLT